MKDEPTPIYLAQGKMIQKAGEAAGQMIQAYKGKRYDSLGNEIAHHGRSLKRISEYKVNPLYKSNNIKQQAGFSAELVNEARKNKKLILSNSEVRIRTTDGVGRTNDTQYDLVQVDGNGNVIDNSASQVKFLGVTADGKYKVIENIVRNKSWSRYDRPIEVPSEQYSSALEYANKRAEDLIKEAEYLEANGKTEIALKKRNLSERYSRAAERIIKSEVSTNEAIDARKESLKFTIGDTATDCLKAGTKMMTVSALIGGAVSVAHNAAALSSGDKEFGEALISVAEDTVIVGAGGLAVGTASTGVKALMHTSENALIRKIGTTNAPVAIVTGTMEIAKSLKRFANGEIDALGLFNELGQKGVCTVTSSVCCSFWTMEGAVISNAAAGVFGVAGGIAGYAAAAALYDSVVQVLEDEKVSYERRQYLDELSAEAWDEMEKYRKCIRVQGDKVCSDFSDSIANFLTDIVKAVNTKDPNKSIRAFNRLNSRLGFDILFKSFEEADRFMADKNTVFEL